MTVNESRNIYLIRKINLKNISNFFIVKYFSEFKVNFIKNFFLLMFDNGSF